MNLLIIEDDMNKIKQLKEFIECSYPNLHLEQAHSFRSGLRKILDLDPTIVLLDMSLPTYDITMQEKGGRPRSLGGRDILHELKRRRIKLKAIVVTQFEDFPDEKGITNLETLQIQLASNFPENYAGTVFYQASGSEWQSDLRKLLDLCIQND